MERKPLTGKDRREIRAALHSTRPVVQVGKAGLDDRVLRSADEALVAREAIKIAFGRSCPLPPELGAAELARALGAELIGCTGRTAILYRSDEAREIVRSNRDADRRPGG